MTKLNQLRAVIEQRLEEVYKALPPRFTPHLGAISSFKSNSGELYAIIKTYQFVLEQIRFLEKDLNSPDPEIRQ